MTTSRSFEKVPALKIKYSDLRIRKHGDVAYNLVDYIRFWSIIGVLYIAQILSGAKKFKGKGIKKFSLAEYAMRRFNSKTSFTVQIIGKFAELRYPL